MRPIPNNLIQPPTSSRVTAVCLVILANIATAHAFMFTKAIMIPFVLSLFIAFTVSPLVDLIRKYIKVPRIIAIMMTLLIVTGFLVIFGLLISTNVKVFLTNIEAYQEKVYAAAEYLMDRADSWGLGIRKEAVIESLRSLPVFDYVSTTAGKIFSGVVNFALVTIFVLFLLTGKEQAMPKKGMWAQIGTSTRKYLLTKTVMSMITGALTALIFTILGLDMAATFCLLAFLLNFIPTLGSLLALLIPMPVALIQFDSSILIMLCILLPGAVQMVVGGIMEPKLMGDTLDLHPVTILLALMFWGLLWGPIGALLATPICVIIKSVLLRFEASHDFGELMAGRLPSLETLES